MNIATLYVVFSHLIPPPYIKCIINLLNVLYGFSIFNLINIYFQGKSSGGVKFSHFYMILKILIIHLIEYVDMKRKSLQTQTQSLGFDLLNRRPIYFH